MVKNKDIHIMKKAFTLSETLVTLAIVGIIAAVTMPALKSVLPNEELAMQKKANFIVEGIVSDLINNDNLYPYIEKINAQQNLGNVDEVEYRGKKYKGNTKFCKLFAAKIGINAKCEEIEEFEEGKEAEGTITSSEGITWILPITEFDNPDKPAYIHYDVKPPKNKGEKDPKDPNCYDGDENCKNPDRFVIEIYQDGTLNYIKKKDIVK